MDNVGKEPGAAFVVTREEARDEVEDRFLQAGGRPLGTDRDGRADGDLAIELERTSQEAGVYPIVLISYMIACEQYSDNNTASIVKSFLEYVASEEGQTAAADAAGSAPISDSLRERVNSAIDLIVTQ